VHLAFVVRSVLIAICRRFKPILHDIVKQEMNGTQDVNLLHHIIVMSYITITLLSHFTLYYITITSLHYVASPLHEVCQCLHVCATHYSVVSTVQHLEAMTN